MVQSSIGIGVVPLIAEESILDPIVGVVAGIAYGGHKIYDKIRGRNNDDYSLDAPTNEEEKKEPTAEDMMQGWRDARSRDARRRQAVQIPPHQLPPDDLEVPNEEGFSWNDIIPQAQEPAQVIQEGETRDFLDIVPRDVQIPLEEEKQQQPQFVDNEQEIENRQFGRPNPGGNGDPNPGGNGDPNPGGNNQQAEEQKNNRGGIQNSPLFKDAVNQIINQIDSLKKQKEDEQNKSDSQSSMNDAEQNKSDSQSSMNDAERRRYISDIEVQIRSQQQLIDLLTKFGKNQIDINKLNDELDQIQQSIQAQKIQQFTEDYVFSDIVQSF